MFELKNYKQYKIVPLGCAVVSDWAMFDTYLLGRELHIDAQDGSTYAISIDSGQVCLRKLQPSHRLSEDLLGEDNSDYL